MDGALTPPAVTLVLGVVTAFLAAMTPIALKLIDAKVKPTVPAPPPPPPVDIDVVADMDAQIGRLDNENARLVREIDRLREQLVWERAEHASGRPANGDA